MANSHAVYHNLIHKRSICMHWWLNWNPSRYIQIPEIHMPCWWFVHENYTYSCCSTKDYRPFLWQVKICITLLRAGCCVFCFFVCFVFSQSTFFSFFFLTSFKIFLEGLRCLNCLLQTLHNWCFPYDNKFSATTQILLILYDSNSETLIKYPSVSLACFYTQTPPGLIN